ncbi:MAG: HAD-IA family hydrolase [Candidatus Limnocylindrales bacterium]
MPAPRPLPTAVLFDWDGTLVDTIPMIYRANVVALRAFGIELTREWYRERYTPDWRRSYRELGIPEHHWEAVAARWGEEMTAGRPRALPWARPALARLRRRGIRIGLVTASTRAVVEPNLRRLNLDRSFEAIRYSDDVARSKPHPDALLEALAEMDVDAAAAVYVGDTTVDHAMATAAAVPFVAIGGTTVAARFQEVGVDHVWPSVGTWAADLLGEPAPARREPADASPKPVRPARGDRPPGA